MGHLEGKRIVITGSSRGLGRAFARACAAEGARVVVNGTNQQAIDESVALIRSTGGTATAVNGSVAEEDTCKALVSTCVREFGGIDVMIHNAGIVRDRTLLKMSVEDWDDVIAVHLRGAFLCTKYAGLAMKEQPEGGHIVQVISASGLSGGFGQGNYAAAKEGMMGLMRTVLLELSRSNIRCNAMWPVADTDMTQVVFERAAAAAQAEGRTAPQPSELGFGQPEEVAQGMVWLVSDHAKHLNGQCLSFNGYRTALWSHPAEQSPTFHDAPWQVEDLIAHYQDAPTYPVYRPQLAP